MTLSLHFTLGLVCALALGCSPSTKSLPDDLTSAEQSIADALSFHASFDGTMDADYARGDARLYSAPSLDDLSQRTPGVAGGDLIVEPDAGRFGDALNFRTQNTKAVVYNAVENVAFSPQSWSGTVSFWLSLDPATDLEPGYSDPIQITDAAYNDNAVWVDFTDQNPRRFRLGVFGDLDVWNQGYENPPGNPVFLERLVNVSELPFGRGTWTHVAIAYEDLGSGAGSAKLYLDGIPAGTIAVVAESFSWDLSAATIRLGVNYTGLFDDLAIFDRPLSEDEIRTIGSLAGGVGSLHK